MLRRRPKRIVGAKHDLRDRNHFGERRHCRGVRHLRCVVIKLRGRGRVTLWKFRGVLLRSCHTDKPLDQERHGAATMREDHADIRIPRGGAAKNHLRNCARGVGTPFDGAVAEIGNQVSTAVRCVWMSVDHRIASVQLLENRIK